VQVACLIDGIPCGTGTFTFSGPGPVNVFTSVPWIAIPGSHTVIWSVDPNLAYNDPNRANNSGNYIFAVAAGPPPAQFDFSLSASPTTSSMNPGDQTTYIVTVSLASGTAQSVSLSLSGLPSGAKFQFSPPSGTPPFTSTLTIASQPDAPAGSYDLTLLGSGGGNTRSAVVKLIISTAPDFSITTTSPSQTGVQGQTVAYVIQVNPSGAFGSPISLSASGLPMGATAIFEPQTGTPPLASTLRVLLGDRSSPGSYTLVVSATGGGKTRTLSLVLNVQEKATGTDLLANWPLLLAIAILIVALLLFIRSRKKERKRRPSGSRS